MWHNRSVSARGLQRRRASRDRAQHESQTRLGSDASQTRGAAARPSHAVSPQPGQHLTTSLCRSFSAAQSLISAINFLSHSASLAQNTLLIMSHSIIHLPPAHHCHPPSYIHCFIPGSKLTYSTNLFHHSLLAPTWTAFLILYWTRLTLLNGFSFFS